MALDFQQVREQVMNLGKDAVLREQRLQALREQASALLEANAKNLEHLRQKVQSAVRHDPSLRCALPAAEALNAAFPLPPLPGQATILAVDGSQINPDRHAEVGYCLINVGAIRMRHGSPEPPQTFVACELFYGDRLYTPRGTLTEEMLALKRDLNERRMLLDLAAPAPGPVITFTDGPLELWGAKGAGGSGDGEESSEFRRSLDLYLEALEQMQAAGVITGGYVDKPGANLVVRTLEVALMAEDDLPHVRDCRPLLGVTEFDLYGRLLQPGERSAVFAMQSQSAKLYPGALALHFFYLNVGGTDRPWLARVEVPAWVAQDGAMLDSLHAVLVRQCRIMGARAYPYLLHRAHETALVSFEEKDQVSQMILLELRQRGLQVGEVSHKQAHKNLSGRTRYRG